MTHLRIEQNNILENVSSAVIEKLYELATSGDLDASSHLAGNLYVPATYLEYIDVLTDLTNTKFRDLTITSGITYMVFLDPEVENKLKGYVGDGTGVISSRFQAMTLLPNGYMVNSGWVNLFINDTSLTSFNELVQATNCTTLGNSAFEGCTNLLQINISNITSVGSDCFLNCRNCVFNGTLSNLQSIGSLAFLFCYKLTGNLVLPHVSSMGNNAFEACKISSVNLTGSTITTIPNSAFCNISTLTTATVPTSVTEIVWRAFGDDSALTTVSGLSNVTIIGGHAFESCSNLTTVDIDWTKITNIGESAFYGCSLLSSAITIQNTVTYIGNKAFYNCRNISSITFQTGGSNALTIDGDLWDGPFRGTYSVNKIIFPENLSLLVAGALNIDNDETKIFVFTSTTPPSIGGGGLAANALGVNQNGHTIYVPDSSVTAYQNALGSNLSGKIYPVSQMPT